MSRRTHGVSGVSEEYPRRATALPRSSDRRLTDGVLVACKEFSLRIDGVHTALNAFLRRLHGVYTSILEELLQTYAYCRNRHAYKWELSDVIYCLIFVDADN